jgi:ribosomal protein L11 methyltransferase
MTRLENQDYDVVLVNIVADVIISLAPVLPDFLTENSTLILSGILDTRLADVTAAIEKAGLRITSVREKEDWRCVCAVRRSV